MSHPFNKLKLTAKKCLVRFLEDLIAFEASKYEYFSRVQALRDQVRKNDNVRIARTEYEAAEQRVKCARVVLERAEHDRDQKRQELMVVEEQEMGEQFAKARKEHDTARSAYEQSREELFDLQAESPKENYKWTKNSADWTTIYLPGGSLVEIIPKKWEGRYFYKVEVHGRISIEPLLDDIRAEEIESAEREHERD